MKARLVIDASAQEFAAACGNPSRTLDAIVVEVASRDGDDGIQPLSVVMLGTFAKTSLDMGAAGAPIRVSLPPGEEVPDG